MRHPQMTEKNQKIHQKAPILHRNGLRMYALFRYFDKLHKNKADNSEGQLYNSNLIVI